MCNLTWNLSFSLFFFFFFLYCCWHRCIFVWSIIQCYFSLGTSLLYMFTRVHDNQIFDLSSHLLSFPGHLSLPLVEDVVTREYLHSTSCSSFLSCLPMVPASLPLLKSLGTCVCRRGCTSCMYNVHLSTFRFIRMQLAQEKKLFHL